jgi:hypothetical protein
MRIYPRRPKIFIQERFPTTEPPLDLSNEAIIAKYHSELEASRRQAEVDRLRSGLCFELPLTIPSSNPHPNSRAVPQFPPNLSAIPLRLAQALQSGPDKNSQVWTAVVDVPGEQTTVVLKIIQPSMCRYPEVDYHYGWEHDYIFPQTLAVKEASAYSRLQHMQGRCIPYFFGLHTVRTIPDISIEALNHCL